MYGRNVFAIWTVTATLTITAMLGATMAVAEDDDKHERPILPLGAGDDLFPKEAGVVHDSKAVQAVIAANPGRELVICLAGCKAGHASVLWQRLTPVALVDAGGGLAGLRSTRFDESASVPSKVATSGEGSAGAVVCVAGCDGPVGFVVYRGMRLAWIRDDRREQLAAALRRIGDRLNDADRRDASASSQRTWVADTARTGITAAMGNSPVVAFDRAKVGRNDVVPRG